MSHTLILRARKAVIALSAIATLSLAQVSHAAYTQMVSFGDSLSDVGNVFLATGGATPPAPYFGGRFSDGLLWNEVLASNLGIAAPTPSLAGGTGHAYGGARVIVDTTVPSLQSQVNGYLAANGGVADPNALYTLFGGGNDLNGVSAGTVGILEVFAAADQIGLIAQQLLDAGAQAIMVVNVPNVGLAPIAAGDPGAATGLTEGYNTGVAASIAGKAGVALLDTFAISNAIAANPAAYGITNTSDACINDLIGGLVSDCSAYLFFDDLHPTAAAGAAIAAGAEAVALSIMPTAVPVPAALPLMMSALAGLFATRRLKKAQA